jgi:hypothetical protein
MIRVYQIPSTFTRRFWKGYYRVRYFISAEVQRSNGWLQEDIETVDEEILSESSIVKRGFVLPWCVSC